MKNVVWVVFMVCIGSVGANAQSSYPGRSSSGINCVANGFRTVSEENAYREQVMADRRKKELKESGVDPEQDKPAPVRQPAAKKAVVANSKPVHHTPKKKSPVRMASR